MEKQWYVAVWVQYNAVWDSIDIILIIAPILVPLSPENLGIMDLYPRNALNEAGDWHLVFIYATILIQCFFWYHLGLTH